MKTTETFIESAQTPELMLVTAMPEYRPDPLLPPMLQFVNQLCEHDITEELDLLEADTPAVVAAFREINSPYDSRTNVERLETVMSLAFDDYTDQEIADMLELTRPTVSKYVETFTSRAVEVVEAGEDNPAGVISRYVTQQRKKELKAAQTTARKAERAAQKVARDAEKAAHREALESAKQPPKRRKKVGGQAVTAAQSHPAPLQVPTPKPTPVPAPKARHLAVVPSVDDAPFVYSSAREIPGSSPMPAEGVSFVKGVESSDNPQMEGLCAETDPEAFFPEKGGTTKPAKKICGECTVRVACLTYALEHDERFGIWGGKSERERRKLKKQMTDEGLTLEEALTSV